MNNSYDSLYPALNRKGIHFKVTALTNDQIKFKLKKKKH